MKALAEAPLLDSGRRNSVESTTPATKSACGMQRALASSCPTSTPGSYRHTMVTDTLSVLSMYGLQLRRILTSFNDVKIQKVDALKYFALYNFGGVNMDLDVACRRSLDPLLDFPAWFPEASPLGVNNDLMASAAKHPVVKKMTEGLVTHNWNLLFPYLTIFWTTGPQFTSTILQEWFEACPDGQCKQWKARNDLGKSATFVL